MRKRTYRFWPVALLLAICMLLTACGSTRSVQIVMSMDEPAYRASLTTTQPHEEIAAIFSGGDAYVYPATIPTPTPTPVPGSTEPDPGQPSETPPSLLTTTPAPTVSGKVAYLTFDDGPSKYTNDILDILKEEGVPATFFVIGSNIAGREQELKRIHEEGHKIGNHTYSHDTDKIYVSTQTFLDDIHKCEEEIQKVIPGYFSDVIRFPKGSGYKNAKNIREEVNAYGYHYYDWCVLNGDAETSRKRSVDELYARFIETLNAASRRQHITILMHDTSTKENTVKMLRKAIRELKSRGYEMRVIPETDD